VTSHGTHSLARRAGRALRAVGQWFLIVCHAVVFVLGWAIAIGAIPLWLSAGFGG
jgi:hypothetical protein